MTRTTDIRWFLLVAANVAVWCVLSLQQSVGANPRAASNNTSPTAIQQRNEIIAQLREIKAGINQLVSYRQNGSLPEPDPIRP